MKEFKFLSENLEEQPNRPLLENEQIIRYWNGGDYHNILHSRVIAWARGTHVFSDDWIQRGYEGTLEQFFTNRLEIPVILSFEALIPNGATLYEDDREYVNYVNFDGSPFRIKYYEII